jgi:uncharacterized membrane protein
MCKAARMTIRHGGEKRTGVAGARVGPAFCQNALSYLVSAAKPYHGCAARTREASAMRVARSVLTVLLFAVAVLCAGSGHSQAQTFRFQVCNRTNVSASVATSSLVSVGDSRFEVQGWWTVGPGSCEWIGYFPQGWFYYYAEQTNTGQYVWQGKDVSLCVQYPGPFDRINIAGYNCQSNEALRGFTSDFISASTGTFTANLN